MVEEKAFDPEFLTRLDRLILAIKHARAQRPGQRSLGRVQGAGLEIENFRPYVQGDDLRFLDWNALGRLDELIIRTHRSERKVEISILVDLSASMRFPVEDDKAGLALAVASSVAYIAMSENDAVRIVGIGRRGNRVMLDATPFFHRRDSYYELRPFLKKMRFRGETALDAGVAEILNQRKERGVAVIVSDFLTPFEQWQSALKRLLAAGYEVAVLHVLGQHESQGTYAPGIYRVYDSETGQMRELRFERKVASLYLARLHRLVDELRTFCHRNNIPYVRAFGAENFETIVTQEFPRLGLVH